MKVLILAGGLGTRLRNYIPDRPKSMVEAGGKPFLEYQIGLLKEQGFEQIVLCVGYRAKQIQEYFGNGNHLGVHISYTIENTLLGTAGAIKNAQKFIEDQFLVLNGDSYQEIDFRKMTNFHFDQRRNDPRLIGTIATRFMVDCVSFGKLTIDSNKRILGFHEKSETGFGLINAGAYILEPEIFKLIPKDKTISIEKQTFPLAIKRNFSLFSYQVSGFFVDIGTPESYERFKQYIEGRSYDYSL